MMSNHFQDNTKNILLLKNFNIKSIKTWNTCCSIYKEEYEIVFVFKSQKSSKNLSTQLYVAYIRGKT